jgi:hypothetical protein
MPIAPVVIFMTSNGVGMGHLSRQLTTALSGPRRFNVVVFSLSGALPRIMAAEASGELPEASGRGIRYEYCPSWESGWFPTNGWRAVVRRHYRSYRWAPYLRDRIVALAAETRASALVFDGVVPYDGLLQARVALRQVKFAWVRRGLWRPGTPERRLDASRHFDLTIEPGDIAAASDRGPTAGRSDAQRVAPVSLIDVLEPTSRAAARATLGLPQAGPVLLLAPGSGALGSVEGTTREILRAVRERGPEWTVAVTRQPIAKHEVGTREDDVVVLDDVYPLARHLNAFDAAVGAAGYNSLHELLSAHVPSLFVPSTSHVTDDQEARAAGASLRHAAIIEGEDGLHGAVGRLLDPDVQHGLRTACSRLERPTGGGEAANLIADLAASGSPTSDGLNLAAPPHPWIDLRTRTRPGSSASIVTSEHVKTTDVRGTHPIEHILAGSSVEYRRTRERASSWLYRVR